MDTIDACIPVGISDDDVFQAMKEISGYIDITPGDFKEIYTKAYEHALKRLWESVKVHEIMMKDVIYVTTATPLDVIAGKMAESKVSGVPVLDEGGQVVGIISEHDFFREMSGGRATGFMDVIASCLGGKFCLAAPARKMKASDIMSSPVTTIGPEASIAEVSSLFSRQNINRLPVIDKSNRLIGIVCRGDLIRLRVRG